MIFTHPVLFNVIVAFFIAFTSGWLVFVIIDRRSANLKRRMGKLEKEKQTLLLHTQQLEAQLEQPHLISNNTPVISMSSSVKMNKTKDAGI